MIKLLSLLTISMLATIVPTPLLANTTLEQTKRDISTLTSNSNSDYLQLKKISGIGKSIFYPALDSKDNIYFVTRDKLFVLKHGRTTPTPINGIKDNIQSLAVDTKDNIYIATNKGLYKLTVGSDTPTKIDGISYDMYSLAVDTKDNLYFIKANMEGTYLLKHGDPTASKIDIIPNSVNNIVVDTKDNIYFVDNDTNGTFKLSVGSDTPTKINGISQKIRTLKIDSKDNIYYVLSGSGGFVYVLKHGDKNSTKSDGISSVTSLAIDSEDNVYLGSVFFNFSILQTALSWIKEQSKFNLVDRTKTQTWTLPDLLTVDGELNIDIANPNIDKVLFDNVQQSQTNKQWNINVKPETSEKDHNLQVFFTLDGKQYIIEITVSMQAKIDPPTPSKQENLSDVIKFSDENNLGSILDNNNGTIISAITQKNSRQVDFSQIVIEKKDMHSTTLTAKKDSKSYQGSVVVKYNVVPATVVDLKIDLKPTSPSTQVDGDYVGQIDKNSITNPVNTFYYANSESKITMVKRVVTGVVYGCDEQWNKTSQSNAINPTSGIKLGGSQLATKDGKYVVELYDNLGHTNNIYLQIAPKQTITNYFDTDNGKQFELWAKANGHDGIREYSAIQLNKLFEESKSWIKQANDSQFADATAAWFKANDKLASKESLTKEQVIEQLKTEIPSANDIKIDGVNTSNYDVNKVGFEINKSEFKPNDKVNIVVKYGSENSNSFTLQIGNSNPPNNNKKGLTGWAIIGIVIGSLSGLLLLGWLFKKFVVTPYILEPIRKKKAKAFAEKTAKDIAQMKKDEAEEEAKRKGGK
ncbi:hypothetical protein [Spiroplasma endosymbiont of Polydrusus pterygomalis]|uniref:hypothetical protein n=1 Tax=Spiroplasma endosymbiont of Polydrusus pterygomalis TaxID=3139327 RepID=UPI003CCB2439